MDHPGAFYKYLSVEATESVLSRGRLRWSSPLLFDDPTEFQRMPRFSPSMQDSGSTFVKTLVDLAAGAAHLDEARFSSKAKILLESLHLLVKTGLNRKELINDIGLPASNGDQWFEVAMKGFVETLTLESTRVLCVTTDGDSDTMWERYAEKGRGALLEFRHIPELSTPLLAAKQVMYATEPPVVGSGLDFLLYGDTHELRARCLDAIIYTKKAEWHDQREWRAVTWRTDQGGARYGDYSFHDAELASVTVGAKASESWALEIRHLVATRYPTCQFLWNRGQCARA
jgi:hypothetical protein